MTRSIVLGNGKLSALFDEKYLMKELYYPLSIDNHLHAGRVGVLTRTGFHWIHDLDPEVSYEPDTIVSKAEITLDGQSVSVTDTVDLAYPILIRKVKLTGGVFFAWDLHINGVEYGDTALYDPSTLSVIHYKRDKWFLFSCGVAPYQYATGYKETGSYLGTWKDCEDGALSNNPIAQGAVDSAVSFEVRDSLTCWLVAGRSYRDVVALHEYVLERGGDRILDRTRKYWKAWLVKARYNEIKRSLLMLASHFQDNGALPASLDTDIMRFNRDNYNYVWHRDAAFAVIAMALAGYEDLSRKFFHFSKPLLFRGFLFQKYTVDGHWGSTWHPWTEKYLPIQEDETALMIYALWIHFSIFKDVDFIKDLYRPGIKAAADFLCSYLDDDGVHTLPSHDLWEERYGVHFFTQASVYAGLISASKFASFFGEDDVATKYLSVAESLRKGLDTFWVGDHFARSMINGRIDSVVDSSTVLGSLLVFPRDEKTRINRQTVERVLGVNGGIARYEGDSYLRDGNSPNPWFITTLWVAQELIAEGNKERALEYIKWVEKNSLKTGVIPEQITPSYTYPSVSPLVWSHAELIRTCHYLNQGSGIT